jgi:hypothetical protein
MKKDEIKQLWEMQFKDMFAECFETHKGRFVTIAKGSKHITIDEEEALMILRQMSAYKESKNDK